MGKTNYSVARVVTYTKQNIGKAERHNERKNKVYSNMNVDLEQTKNNVYYKTCNTTYNERLKELVDENKVSLRGLKYNAKIFDELILDINSDYFEKHGGYNFAKKFYEEAFHFAEKEYGKDNIISAVMHADEQNIALTEEYGKPIYHYHLHVIALPVVKKEIKYSKRTKDKSLVGKVKETIMQVSHSKKWKSQKALDNEGNEILNDKGKPVLIKSYSLLQDRFYKYMSDNGYKDFIRGEKGSTVEHLSDIEFKAKKEREKLEAITDKVKEQQRLEKLYTPAERKILANITDYDKEYLNRFEGETRERVEHGLIEEYRKQLEYQEKVNSPEYNKRRTDKNAR